MKISYNWLKTLLPIDLAPELISEVLTDIGLEVERTETISSVPGGLKDLIIGEIKSKQKHPN